MSIAAAFSPDGKMVLSSSYDNTMRLWDVESAKELHRFESDTEGVWGISFSPDGKWAISGNSDKTVRLWQLAD